MKLIGRIKPLIFNNVSLLVVVLGALSNFVLILFIKKFIPESFNTYSLYITYLSIIVSFGLVGFDQIMLRLSKIEAEKTVISKDVFISILVSGVVAPIVISYYFSLRYESLHFILLTISGLSINSMILAYNTLRLNKNFLKSQLFHNGYKVVFLLTFVMLYFFIAFQVDYIVLVATAILFVFGTFAISDIYQNISISQERTSSLLNYFFSFSINMALLTALSYGERILIANELGEEVFGNYFYYSTIFLFPLTLLQYYVGFKELVYFKEGVNKKLLHCKLLKIFVGGALIVAAVILLVKIDGGTFLTIDIKANLILVILLSALGIIKLVYGLFSALMGAKAKYQDIYLINIFTFILLAILLPLLFLLGITVNLVVLGLIIIFAARGAFIYLKYA